MGSDSKAQVTVKALQWEREEYGWWSAQGHQTRLSYEVRQTDSGAVRTRGPAGPWEYFEGTLEAAKAAAQADYEQRVLSSIEGAA